MLLRYQRQCSGCKKMKMVDLEDKKASEFYIVKNNGVNGKRGALLIRPQSICKLCQCEAVEKRRMTLGAEGAASRARARAGWVERNPEEHRRSRRDYQRRKRGWVDPEPFAEWLREFVLARAHQVQQVEGQAVAVYSARTIAEAGGLNISTVKRMLKGKTPRRLLLKEVDSMLVFCGVEYLLAILYPLEQEEGKDNLAA